MTKVLLTALLGCGAMFGFSAGPPASRTGAPVDGGTSCTACHRTFPVNPDTTGFVRIQASPYTPGARQTVRVTVSHPEATRWGFQLTARLASDETRRAGVLAAGGPVRVVCAPAGTPPCDGLEFATQNASSAGGGSNGARTYEVEWTPPATASGEVVFYAAGNAADGSGSSAGDRIYTTSLRISPAGAGGGAAPTINMGGVITANEFGGATTVAPGTYVEIYGANFSTATREWSGSFSGVNAPRELEGVSVTFGGTAAAIQLVSPGQINCQVPASDAVGPVEMRVTNPAGSATMPVTMARVAPGLYAPARFRINDRQFVGVVHANGNLDRTARPGETISLFGLGFGPTMPAVPFGTVAQGNANLTSTLAIRVGETAAMVPFAGLIRDFVGLYQFNVTIPMATAPGDYRLNVDLAGAAIPQTLFINVAN